MFHGRCAGGAKQSKWKATASSFFVVFFGKRSAALPDDGPSQQQSRPAAPFGASQASSAAEHDIGWHEEGMGDGWDPEQLEDMPFDPEENLSEEPVAPQQRATTDEQCPVAAPLEFELPLLPLPVQLPLQSVPDPSRSGTVLRRVEARSPMPAAGDEDLISTMLAQAQQDGSTNRREAGCAPPTPAFASHFSDPSAALALAALVLASASVVWRAARGQAQQQAGSAEVICAGGAEGEQICWTRVRPCPPHLRRTFPACLFHNPLHGCLCLCCPLPSEDLRASPPQARPRQGGAAAACERQNTEESGGVCKKNKCTS